MNFSYTENEMKKLSTTMIYYKTLSKHTVHALYKTYVTNYYNNRTIHPQRLEKYIKKLFVPIIGEQNICYKWLAEKIYDEKTWGKLRKRIQKQTQTQKPVKPALVHGEKDERP